MAWERGYAMEIITDWDFRAHNNILTPDNFWSNSVCVRAYLQMLCPHTPALSHLHTYYTLLPPPPHTIPPKYTQKEAWTQCKLSSWGSR